MPDLDKEMNELADMAVDGRLINFANAMVAAGELPERFDYVSDFLCKPWKWAEEYKRWNDAGRPEAMP